MRLTFRPAFQTLALQTLCVLLCAAFCQTAAAKPAAWHLWMSRADGRLICRQVSPGPGWQLLRGPYRDARCQQAGQP
ncbi:MAG: hypothetical protein ACK5JI_02845 [Azonexus sp.]